MRDLAGIRLGLLDNTKANAARVLETLAEQLRAQHRASKDDLSSFVYEHASSHAFAAAASWSSRNRLRSSPPA